MNKTSNDLLTADKIRGCLIGGAVGDAYGYMDENRVKQFMANAKQ